MIFRRLAGGGPSVLSGVVPRRSRRRPGGRRNWRGHDKWLTKTGRYPATTQVSSLRRSALKPHALTCFTNEAAPSMPRAEPTRLRTKRPSVSCAAALSTGVSVSTVPERPCQGAESVSLSLAARRRQRCCVRVVQTPGVRAVPVLLEELSTDGGSLRAARLKTICPALPQSVPRRQKHACTVHDRLTARSAPSQVRGGRRRREPVAAACRADVTVRRGGHRGADVRFGEGTPRSARWDPSQVRHPRHQETRGGARRHPASLAGTPVAAVRRGYLYIVRAPIFIRARCPADGSARALSVFSGRLSFSSIVGTPSATCPRRPTAGTARERLPPPTAAAVGAKRPLCGPAGAARGRCCRR